MPRLVRLAAIALVVAALSGCRPDPSDSGVDGYLWRQVAEHLDPVKHALYNGGELYDAPPITVAAYLALIPATRWDGTSAPEDLGLLPGGAVLHNLERSDDQLSFDVFVSSGPRPDVTSNDGWLGYFGPHSVYTCFGWTVDVTDGMISRDPYNVPGSGEPYTTCDTTLVATLADDAGFAPIDAFNG